LSFIKNVFDAIVLQQWNNNDGSVDAGSDVNRWSFVSQPLQQAVRS